jgi:hypothetical protein
VTRLMLQSILTMCLQMHLSLDSLKRSQSVPAEHEVGWMLWR